MTYPKPRNDFVLIQVVDLGKTLAGIAVSDSAIEGKEFIVRSIGPKVEGLEIGDKVLMVGTKNQDYSYLPASKDLLVIKEANIILVFPK